MICSRNLKKKKQRSSPVIKQIVSGYPGRRLVIVLFLFCCCFLLCVLPCQILCGAKDLVQTGHHQTYAEFRRGHQISRTGVTDDCELPYGF